MSATTACGDDGVSEPAPAPGFLGGVAGNREIGVVVNSTGRAVTMFQLGQPSTTISIPLGSSSAITPVGLSLRGRKAAVPLGNAASVALVNLETATVQRFFTFPSGNATGSAWANDTTVFVANTDTDKVGRFYLNQTNAEITATATVAPTPTAVVVTGGRVLVVSGNLANFSPIGPGVVTAINPATMAALGTVQSGGLNPTDAAVGPDGLLYVLNTGDYITQSSVGIVNPATMSLVATIPNMGVGAGAISIDDDGIAYVSGFFSATVVWNSKTRTFVRAADNPVCAKAAGLCRGAFAATSSATGKLFQVFFGSPQTGLAPYVFVFNPTTFALTDSIAVGTGPSSLVIRTF
ncbi:MAG: hypothetical protein H7Z40_23470 [Phycisphaerae bacterium]|nr:hypothetical protein [Gemmatimonadaceae bacterium]